MEEIKIDIFNKTKKVRKLVKEDDVEQEETSGPKESTMSNPVTQFAEPDLFGEDEYEAPTLKQEDAWEKAVNEEKPLWEDFGLERNMRAMYPKSQYQR